MIRKRLVIEKYTDSPEVDMSFIRLECKIFLYVVMKFIRLLGGEVLQGS